MEKEWIAEYEKKEIEDLLKLLLEDGEGKLQCERNGDSRQISKLNTDMPYNICNCARFKFFMMCWKNRGLPQSAFLIFL